jgi:hypothetical protein
VEINPRETTLTPFATFHLRGAAGIILPGLIDKVWKNKNPFHD